MTLHMTAQNFGLIIQSTLMTGQRAPPILRKRAWLCASLTYFIMQLSQEVFYDSSAQNADVVRTKEGPSHGLSAMEVWYPCSPLLSPCMLFEYRSAYQNLQNPLNTGAPSFSLCCHWLSFIPNHCHRSHFLPALYTIFIDNICFRIHFNCLLWLLGYSTRDTLSAPAYAIL